MIFMNIFSALRLDVCGVSVVNWDGVGLDADVDPVEKMQGDHSREVFFSKSITLLHKGKCPEK